MNKIFSYLLKILSCPVAVHAGIIGISVFSLAFALTAQYAFGMLPCVLCIYQRIPFALNILIGIAGIVLAKFGMRTASGWLSLIASFSFLVGGLTGFYQFGVEQHWWISGVEGCTIPGAAASGAGDFSDLRTIIESAALVPCDQPTWDLFGITFALINALYSLGLFAVSALAGALIVRTQRSPLSRG